MTAGPFRPDERPDVLVTILEGDRAGEWRGELRDWQQRPDGWWAVVSYRTAPGMQYIDVVPATQVRLDETVDPRTSRE